MIDDLKFLYHLFSTYTLEEIKILFHLFYNLPRIMMYVILKNETLIQ
jgi:hypothetical protein